MSQLGESCTIEIHDENIVRESRRRIYVVEKKKMLSVRGDIGGGPFQCGWCQALLVRAMRIHDPNSTD